MPQLVIDMTDEEYRTLAELVREECPDFVTPEKYVYLETLKRLKVFLCGVQVGMDKMKSALHSAREAQLKKQ